MRLLFRRRTWRYSWRRADDAGGSHPNMRAALGWSRRIAQFMLWITHDWARLICPGRGGPDPKLDRCMPVMRRVLIIHTSDDPTMELVRAGIEDHRRERPGWQVLDQYVLPTEEAKIDEMLRWRPDGILSAVNLPPRLLRLRLPWVSLRHAQSAHAVQSDDRAVGTAAAGYLAGLGVASFACIAIRRDADFLGWQSLRPAGFKEELARRGQRVETVHWSTPEGLSGDPDAVLGQIRRLTPPCAIFASNDYLAWQLLEMAIAGGLRIPADVAVLGADDATRSATLQVPLSTVQVAHRRIGKRGAALLDGLMDGTVGGPVLESLPPDGVSERASTSGLVVPDSEVAAVLAFIRQHAHEPFTIEDAISASNLGRRSIEQRFRKLLGHSILEQIHQIRIERACRLLRDSQRTISAVALDCGFNDPQHFANVFRSQTGSAPSVWRRALTRKNTSAS